MTPWLHIVGIGAEGLASLSPAARAALDSAEVVLGGARHHALTEGLSAERIAWPSPFDALIPTLEHLRPRRVAVLATGDPLWFSVGARLAEAFGPEDWVFHPQLSAFQLAAARLGWPLAETDCLSLHGRPPELILPRLAPGARLLCLTSGAETPADVARLLTDHGWGPSRLTVLADMGAGSESRRSARAQDWTGVAPAFHTLAVDPIPGPAARLLPRSPGLPDSAFASDGNMTKQEIRAVTLARLMPLPGQLLWDVGAGSGSVGIEWMRAAERTETIGIEPSAERRALAAANAIRLGTSGLKLIAGRAPEALAGLPAPDAVFLGGGLSPETFDAVWSTLKPGGRLVVNAVTLESEATLLALHARHGGSLTRLAISRVAAVGDRLGWRPAMPVTQWSLLK